jgi:hypothetical protein
MQASHTVLTILSLLEKALAAMVYPFALLLLEFLTGAEKQVAAYAVLKAERIQALVQALSTQVADFRPFMVRMKLDCIIRACVCT